MSSVCFDQMTTQICHVCLRGKQDMKPQKSGQMEGPGRGTARRAEQVLSVDRTTERGWWCAQARVSRNDSPCHWCVSSCFLVDLSKIEQSFFFCAAWAHSLITQYTNNSELDFPHLFHSLELKWHSEQGLGDMTWECPFFLRLYRIHHICLDMAGLDWWQNQISHHYWQIPWYWYFIHVLGIVFSTFTKKSLRY